MIEILKRPRNNFHVPLYNELKKEIKKINSENLNILHSFLKEITEKYEKINGFSYLFHYNKNGDVIILDEDENIILHFKIIKSICEEE